MQSFLSLVADDLLKRFGHDMRDVTVVFPSKRAGLFLTQEFAARCAGTPLWAPRYTTLGDLFLSLSEHVVADPIDAISRLYHIYISRVRESILCEEGAQAVERETLDRFWSWGEIILSDFDDIDKHMADARKVFRHVRELGELSDNSFLSDEQRETLMRFFGYFSTGEDSLVRRRFMRLWNEMPAIYEALYEDLLHDNQLWEGALHRDVCRRIKEEPQLLDRYPHVCFVGFNVLNSVEEQLMQSMGERALFYWDYDEYYVNDPQQEAGEFMRRNLKLFPSALPATCFRNLERLQRVTFVSCPTDNAVARYTAHWMQQGMCPTARENAIVLCNEQLLMPVLHAIPETGSETDRHPVNITMGLPLCETPIFSFVLSLWQLHTEGWDARRQRFRRPFLQSVLRHPYARYFQEDELCQHTADGQAAVISTLIEAVEKVGLAFSHLQAPTITEQLHIESIYQAHRVLTKLHQLLSHPERPLDVQDVTLRRLLRTVLNSTSIPFHGEPASGIQVMGVLETRCLDFPHLLMLSVEEDALPRPTQLNSMIPPLIREAYGLTTPRHRICIYAYYFYRLIQRSQEITCVFNQTASGIKRHEPSRFLRQLQADFPPEQLEIRQIQFSNAPGLTTPQAFLVNKTPQMLERLLRRYAPEAGHPLSPTAINAYLACPMQFYYHYVESLSYIDEESEEVDAMQLGNLFHDTAEIIYTDLIRRHGGERQVEQEWLAPLIDPKSTILRGYLDIAFDMNVFHRLRDEGEKKRFIHTCLNTGHAPKPEYAGQHIIVRDVLLHYLRHLIRNDLRLAPFTMLGMETDCMLTHPVTVGDTSHTILMGGRIDRLDRLADGTLRILDYKTGAHHMKTNSVEGAFARGTRHQGYTFQACLYSLAVMQTDLWNHACQVQPALYYVRDAHAEDYNPALSLPMDEGSREKTSDFVPLAEEFRKRLDETLHELFSPDIPFRQTTDADVCQRCDFLLLCGRQRPKTD